MSSTINPRIMKFLSGLFWSQNWAWFSRIRNFENTCNLILLKLMKFWEYMWFIITRLNDCSLEYKIKVNPKFSL
jgi:hypothetical protein